MSKRKRKVKGVFELLTAYQCDPELYGPYLRQAANALERLPDRKKDTSWITCPQALQFIGAEDFSVSRQCFLVHAKHCEFCRKHREEILRLNEKILSPQELSRYILEYLK